MLPYNQNLKPLARKLRREMTEAERKIWMHIRKKQILDVQFYRQKPLGNYIADFYCPKAKLVVEIDGAQHYSEEGKANDMVRDEFLQSLGLQVLRFSNHDVLKNTDSVLEVIFRTVQSQLVR